MTRVPGGDEAPIWVSRDLSYEGRPALSRRRGVIEPLRMHTAMITARTRLPQRCDTPDLRSQLEDLLIEVWRQEDFERRHPFTCAVIREASRSQLDCRARLD